MNKPKLLIPVLFLLLCSAGFSNKEAEIKNELNGIDIKIVDGDTFDLLTKENVTIRVRMNGID